MATDSQIDANRRNAQLSTGPRSSEGKARSARNALKDGFYSKTIVILPGFESEFESLRASLLDSLKPNGDIQDVLFDEILHASWNLVRARIAEVQVYQQQSDPAFDPLVDDKNEAKLKRIHHFTRTNQLARDRAMKQLSAIQTEIRARLQAFPPDENAGVPIFDQQPHSHSVLCHIKDVVSAIRQSERYRSAPLGAKNAAGKNEADLATHDRLAALVAAALIAQRNQIVDTASEA